jgi:hypothetical protein
LTIKRGKVHANVLRLPACRIRINGKPPRRYKRPSVQSVPFPSAHRQKEQSQEPPLFVKALTRNGYDVIKEGKYSQKELACFHEDGKEALWNSDEHFLQLVYGEIEAIENPMGIPWWI